MRYTQTKAKRAVTKKCSKSREKGSLVGVRESVHAEQEGRRKEMF